MSGLTLEKAVGPGFVRAGWVQCPICDESDMPAFHDVSAPEGTKHILCLNASCESNEGADEAPRDDDEESSGLSEAIRLCASYGLVGVLIVCGLVAPMVGQDDIANYFFLFAFMLYLNT